jgi:hypothetical protein
MEFDISCNIELNFCILSMQQHENNSQKQYWSIQVASRVGLEGKIKL